MRVPFTRPRRNNSTPPASRLRPLLRRLLGYPPPAPPASPCTPAKSPTGRDLYCLGELRFRSKLSPSDVLAIREDYPRGGVTQKELANRYGVSKNTIANVLQGITWPDPEGVRRVHT